MNLGVSPVRFGNLTFKGNVKLDNDGLDKTMEDAPAFLEEEVWNQDEANSIRAQIEYNKNQAKVLKEMEIAKNLGIERY